MSNNALLRAAYSVLCMRFFVWYDLYSECGCTFTFRKNGYSDKKVSKIMIKTPLENEKN